MCSLVHCGSYGSVELNRWLPALGPATGSVLRTRSCSHYCPLLSNSPLCLWTLHCRSTLKKIKKIKRKGQCVSAYRACAVQALLLGFSDAVGSFVEEGVGSKAQACVSKMNQLQKTLKQDTGDSFRQLKGHSRFSSSQALSAASVTHTHGFRYTPTLDIYGACKNVLCEMQSFQNCLMIHLNIFFRQLYSTSKSHWTYRLYIVMQELKDCTTT